MPKMTSSLSFTECGPSLNAKHKCPLIRIIPSPPSALVQLLVSSFLPSPDQYNEGQSRLLVQISLLLIRWLTAASVIFLKPNQILASLLTVLHSLRESFGIQFRFLNLTPGCSNASLANLLGFAYAITQHIPYPCSRPTPFLTFHYRHLLKTIIFIFLLPCTFTQPFSNSWTVHLSQVSFSKLPSPGH